MKPHAKQQTMDAALYIEILRGFLLQFIEEKFQGSGYRFMQDNYLKHTSKKAKNFMSNSESIGGPPQRTVQDDNPIERV